MATPRDRIRALDRACREREKRLTPTPPYPWEIVRDEIDRLRLRNVELEQMVNELQDEIADLKAGRRKRGKK